MSVHLRHRRWQTIWIYLTVTLAWVLITDIAYSLWIHQFNKAAITFFSVRSSLLFIFTLFWFHRITTHIQDKEDSYLQSLDQTSQPVLVGRRGKWTYVNAAGMQLLDAESLSDVVGKSVTEFLYPDEVDAALSNEFNPVNRRSFIFVERKLRSLKGREVETEVLCIPLQLGGHWYTQLFYNDVTPKIHRERQLQSALTNLMSFVEHNSDAVIVFDTNKRVTKINSAFEELFQCTAADVIGQHIMDLHMIVEKRREEVSVLAERVSDGEKVLGLPIVCQTTTGAEVEVLMSLFPLYKLDGTNYGWSAVLHNITQRKQDEMQLLKSEKLATAGQLAAGIAHEIKNPLTTVMGFVGLMPGSSREKQEQYAEIMKDELQRISSIVNELLMLAKPQSESMTLLSIPDVVISVYELLKPEATLRNVEFSLQQHFQIMGKSSLLQGRAAEPLALGYEHRLKQLLINLIRNAMDALSEKPRLVTVNCVYTDSAAVIEVEDTGIGLQPQTLQRLGEPFFTTKEGGTGLGLFLCQQIIRQHQGNLQFNSKVGNGTIVRVSIPVYTERNEASSISPAT